MADDKQDKELQEQLSKLFGSKVSTRDLEKALSLTEQLRDISDDISASEKVYENTLNQINKLKNEGRNVNDAELQALQKTLESSKQYTSQLVQQQEAYALKLERLGVENSLLKNQTDLFKRITDIENERYDKMTETYEQWKKFEALLGKSAALKLKSSFDGMVESAKNIPIIGQAISKRLEQMAPKQQLIMGLVYAGYAKVFSFMFNAVRELVDRLDKSLRTIMDSTGQSAKSAIKLRDAAIKTSEKYGEMGVTLEKSAESIEGIMQTYGNLALANQELIDDVSLLNVRFGTTAQEGAELVKTLQFAGNLTQKAATNMANMVGVLSRKAGLNAKVVMQDIAKNSGVIYSYFKGLPEKAAAAAVKLNQMGLSLSKMAGAADQLLEWDTSIESELNASVMLGKNINLAGARMKAFQGDLEGVAQEIKSQVGSIEEFNKMNILQKRALAQATGLSVEDLTNSLATEDKLNRLRKIGLTQDKLEKKSAAELQQIIKGTNDEQLKGYLQDQLKQTAMEKFNASIDRLKLSLAPVAEAILNVISAIADFINLIRGQKVLGIMLGIVVLLAGLAYGYKLIVKPILEAGESLFKFGEKFKKGAGSAAEGLDELNKKGNEVAENNPIKKFAESLPSPSQILSLAVVMIAFAVSILILAAAFVVFSKVTGQGLITGIVVMAAFVGSLVILSNVLAGFAPVAGIAIAVMLGFASAVLILSAALYISAKAFEIIVPLLPAFALSMLQLIPLAPGIILFGASMMILGSGLILFAAGATLAFIPALLLSVSMIALSGALKIASESLPAFVKGMKNLLGLSFTGLFALGLGLAAVGAILVAFGAEAVLASGPMLILSVALNALSLSLVLISTQLPILAQSLQTLSSVSYENIAGIAESVAKMSVSFMTLGFSSLMASLSFGMISASAAIAVVPISILSNLMESLNSALLFSSQILPKVAVGLKALTSISSDAIFELSQSIYSLAMAMSALGMASIFGLPALLMIATTGAMISDITEIFTGSKKGTKKDEAMAIEVDRIITEIRDLKETLKNINWSVNLDARKVGEGIARIS